MSTRMLFPPFWKRRELDDFSLNKSIEYLEKKIDQEKWVGSRWIKGFKSFIPDLFSFNLLSFLHMGLYVKETTRLTF